MARGFALSLTKKYDLAEAELQRAVELNPSLFEVHYIFGRICLSQGKAAEAAAFFKKACEISPDVFDARYYLGMCYHSLNDPTRALNAKLQSAEAARKRLDQHPDDSRAWTFGANSLAELGEPEKAIEWIDRALAIDPDEPLILYNSACVYISLGKTDEAIACLDSAVGRGFLSKDWFDNDSDLDPIRDDPRFEALMERLD